MRWTVPQGVFTVIFLASVLTLLGLYYLSASGLIAPGELVGVGPIEVHQGSEPALKQQDVETLAQSLEQHTITPDGLLIVNPNGPHPIFQLIRDAEAAWEAKCARASKTLDDAISEYRRRYQRAPPLGFDKWWDYVVKHDVQLPDEYDEIFNDIEPFWGIDPAELALTQNEVERDKKLVTIQKRDTHPRLEVNGSTLQKGRDSIQFTVDNILKYIREVEQDLPPFRISLHPFDKPDMLSDWRIKTMALEAAANRTTLTRSDMPPITERGWIQACPPDSPARLQPPVLPDPSANPPFPPSSPKTFIASHRDTMNPCVHPSLLTTHTQFLSDKAGPSPRPTLLPWLGFCATLLHHDIRPPIPYGWDYDLDLDVYSEGAFEGDVPWERKVDGRLDWRGTTTGIHADRDSLWLHAQRARLVTLTSTLEGNVSVLRAGKDDAKDRLIPVGEPVSVQLALINPAWMDIAFVGRAIWCDKNDTCEQMESLWEFQKVQTRDKEGQYKFILDVDGNAWSGRFKRLMTSNALIFKATIYPEWYMSRIAPWVHYVPIQVSYADLYDAVAFFRTHDELAARIAKAGRDWSQRFWRREDMTAYLFRSLLEYARVTSLDRASMDYVS